MFRFLQQVLIRKCPKMENNNETFLYFAFGSNLLSNRIRIQNPTAKRRGIGRLKNHRLDFFSIATRWNGSPATVVPDPGREVWGAIWEIGTENLASLDNQEGVHLNHYRPLEVSVETPTGSTELCRMYILCENAGPLTGDDEFTKQPSETYLKVIVRGAEESSLPEEYIQWLRSVRHNGRQALPEFLRELKENIKDFD